MYQKNGLFFAVITVVVLMLFVAIAPTPVSAQSDSAARVAIQGPVGEFGDVLLVKDGNDIIINGLSGSVSGVGEVTISADGMTPITVSASFLGHFPIGNDVLIRIPGGVNLASAQITFVKGGSGGTVSGVIPLNIMGDQVLQALRDYNLEVDKILKGEKNQIEKGMPPHILLDVVLDQMAETPTEQPKVGKVLLTQRLLIKKSGDKVMLSLVDQIEGVSGPGITPTLQSLPYYSRAGVYGVPVDVNNPDPAKRVQTIDTVSFVDGAFASNGYFFPFSIPNVNSQNVDAVKAGLADSGISTPQIADVFYLHVTQDLAGGKQNVFLAHINNDVTAGFTGNVLAKTNNDNNAAGVDALALLTGTADPYALITAYAGNDVNSEWIASTQADGAGKFTLAIPPKALYIAQTKEFDSYEARKVVYLGVSDPFGNIGKALVKVDTDTSAIITESPVATPQAGGNMLVAGKTEAGALVFVDGRVKTGNTFYFAGVTKAAADGSFTLSAAPYFEYKVTVMDQAGNTISTTIPGDTASLAPSNLAASAVFPVIRVTGTAEPHASILTFGFDAGVVPENPVETETLPLGAFFLGGSQLEYPETTAKAGADGSFSLVVPNSVGRFIYLQAVDPAGNGSLYVPFELLDAEGNPLSTVAAVINVVSVTNLKPGINDIINARVTDPNTGLAIDGEANGLVAAAFRTVTNETGVLVPFVDQLTELVAIKSDGTFSLPIPERSEDTGEYINQVYLVVFSVAEDGSLRDLCFTIASAEDGFDRIGPKIIFAPMSSDFIIREMGGNASDMLNINRIYPAGTGAGVADLPAGALPYVFILADGGDDSEIDVNSPSTYIVDWKPLNSAIPGTPLPIPGVAGLNLGVNYWDPSTKTVVGNSVVFVALMDALGNFSPNPIPLYLDVTTQDPIASKIMVSGSSIFANEGAVEENAHVAIFENSDKSGLITTAVAYPNGGFAITDLSISQEYVYVFAKDAAGNESNPVKVKVNTPVKGLSYYILDEVGIVHTPDATIETGHTGARAISKKDDGSVYVLYSDGCIRKISGPGDEPSWEDIIYSNDESARDLCVISTKPFKAYVLLGNGLILTYGDTETEKLKFYGDMGNLDPDMINVDPSIPRVPLNDGSGRFFLDLNKNNVRDTEDENGNGILDISVGIGGVLETEDKGLPGIDGTEGNGILDEEKIIDLQSSTKGFGWDIARDLELVKDAAGEVKGYVILDGFGVLWPFGTGIGEENVRPKVTNGISTIDIFRKLQLVVQDGKIIDFITLSGSGEMYALPSDQGGVFGAGSSTDTSTAGLLSADQYGLTLYGFDIARDFEFSPIDTNRDGTVDWKDGFYILDGFGGLHACGGAAEITDSLFLGLDVARRIEF